MPDGGFLNFNFDWGDISTGSRKCLVTFSYTAMFVKNTPPRVVFSTHFTPFGNVVKQGLSCLLYYVNTSGQSH